MYRTINRVNTHLEYLYMYATKYPRPSYIRPNSRKYKPRAKTATSRKSYNAAQQSKAMVVTQSRTTNSANRVGGNGLNRISVGKFRDLPTLWPDKFLCKMKYQDTVNTTITIPSTSTTNSVIYRVNSLWDPLQATTTEAPIAGFNELAAMYGYYRVNASKILASVSPANAAAQTPALVTIGYSKYNPGYDQNTSYAQVLTQTANPYSVWGMTTANAKPLILENYVGMKKLVGSIITATDARYANPVTGSPSQPLYGYLSIGLPAAPVTAAIFTTVLEIEFWAEFYGRDFELV